MLPAPSWKWIGLVIADDAGNYLAVMPIPLRQKRMLGIPYSWVVHQPFFCQFVSVFSSDQTLDPTPFMQFMPQHFRYGSTFRIRQLPDGPFSFGRVETRSTQVLNLSVGYDVLYQRYSRDRKQNLKRALSANWSILASTDPEPLITLFCKNHTAGIDGGVADWAYAILRNLVAELSKRKLMTLRYACRDGRMEAGALFVSEGNRVIYLFNAASEAGRRGNARTLLVDQMIREKAGMKLLFDFESPEKLSIREFYKSFGASDEPFYDLRWSRLKAVEKIARTVVNRLNS
ncbi:GNAT family N-acetyltransferase [Spirosoma radiotolerans]|uniref:GNAT family N-acetyltransferase n=1 Tax=Spirosoma radiotolerans TaxID=1379870 RepID=UPI000B0865E5|nr:GNAT family N-acetyltransferase [Spirosoma radiotolerans]